MDRRMYRGNMGNNCSYNRGPYRGNEPACSDMMDRYDHDPEDACDRDDYDDSYDHDRFPIGMCYVPWQKFRNIYENEFTAIARGTIFKELDLEFYGRSCK